MAEAWKRPTFGTQVAACIAKRVALVPGPAEQQALQDWYVHWLHTKGREAQEKRFAVAWGLDAQDCHGGGFGCIGGFVQRSC